MVLGDPAETKAFQDVADAFEAQNPGVHVTVITLASEEADYFARLGADLAAGTPADVVYLDYRDAARYYANGAFQPITARLAESTLIKADDFYPQALNAFTWEGAQMCIPINISSLVTYYNKDLFDAAGLAYPAAGWTWDDLLGTAQALTRDTDGDSVTDQYGLGVSPQLIRLLPFVWQNGGEFLNAAGDALALDTPEALEALQFFVDLQATHHMVPDRVAEAAQGSQDRFENGTLGMFFQSRRVTTAFRSITAFDWDVAPLPARAQAATILHADGLCIPAEAAHPALAWKLIEFANSVEGQQLMSVTGRTVPSNRAVAESEYFLDPNAKPAHSQVWIDVIPSIRPAPVVRAWEEIEEHADEAIERAFYGEGTAAAALDAIVQYAGPRLED
jgi:multiple sugar transport system substrate-binding protein